MKRWNRRAEVPVAAVEVRVLLFLGDVERTPSGSGRRADARHDLHLCEPIVAGKGLAALGALVWAGAGGDVLAVVVGHARNGITG